MSGDTHARFLPARLSFVIHLGEPPMVPPSQPDTLVFASWSSMVGQG